MRTIEIRTENNFKYSKFICTIIYSIILFLMVTVQNAVFKSASISQF